VKLKPGDTVRVVGARGTAKIRAILRSMHGALLEKRIRGLPQLESGRMKIGAAQIESTEASMKSKRQRLHGQITCSSCGHARRSFEQSKQLEGS
jgi:hypothetical protein